MLTAPITPTGKLHHGQNVGGPSLAKTFLAFILVSLAVTTGAEAQLSRYYIDENRCSVMMPAAPELENALYIDSSRLYIARSVTAIDGEDYYFTAVVLQVRHDSIYQADDNAVQNFLDYYKSTMHVIDSRGVKRSPKLLGKQLTGTLNDEWTDHEGNVFTVQALSSGNRIALLYVFGSKAFPNTVLQRSFFNSFRFPSG